MSPWWCRSIMVLDSPSGNCTPRLPSVHAWLADSPFLSNSSAFDRSSALLVTSTGHSNLWINVRVASIKISWFVNSFIHQPAFVGCHPFGARPAEAGKALGPAWRMDEEGGFSTGGCDYYSHLPPTCFKRQDSLTGSSALWK